MMALGPPQQRAIGRSVPRNRENSTWGQAEHGGGGGIVTVLEAVYAKIGYPKSILVDQGTNFA